MAKELKCGDLMPGCTTVVEGKDEAEVVAKAAEHAKSAHSRTSADYARAREQSPFRNQGKRDFAKSLISPPFCLDVWGEKPSGTLSPARRVLVTRRQGAAASPISARRTDDAEDMARRLAREEALFAGTSSGADVVVAIQVAERLGPHAKVVTLMVDSGLKYLSTDVYRSRRYTTL